MKTTAFLALSAALFGFSSAAPVEKRDNVYQVVTSEVIKTVVLTSTVWVDPVDVATLQNNGGQFFETSTTPSSTPTPTPTPTPESSTPPPPPPPSSSAPPPPPPTSQAPPPPPAPETTQAPPPPAVTPAAAPPPPAPSSQAPPPPPPAAPKQSSSPATGGPTTGDKSGQMTYYTPGLGACGVSNTEEDWIVAISTKMYDAKTPGGATGNPNNNPLCGQKINIFFDGKSFPATIEDRCEACALDDLDMPIKMFNAISGDQSSAGRLQMTWSMA